MKAMPFPKPLRVLAVVLVVLFTGPGMSGGGPVDQPVKPAKRVGRLVPRQARDLRSEKIAGRRRLPAYSQDRVLLRFRSDVPEAYAEALLQSYGFRSVRRNAAIGVYSVQTAAGVSVGTTLAMLRRNGDIERVRPDYRARLTDLPNDSYFLTYQWNLRNKGGVLDINDLIQPTTTAGADIKAMAAWDVTHGDPEVVIAVLDTGVDMTHPELVNKVVSTGHDFANDDDDATDDVWHGTHVAGIAAAETDNAAGIAGVAWNCKVLPVKVADETGDGYYSWIIDGITWATDHGADVINLSMGGDYADGFLEDACKYAYDHGVVVVAAAGNNGTSVLYPAAYDAYVLAVAATDYNDTLASFSSSGPQVDVAAPGVYILAPAPQWYVGQGHLPYLFGSGTSMAAPHVAGLAALIRSLKPDLGAAEIMNVIRYTADDVNAATLPGRDNFMGYGRINMERALVPYILK
jgi:thermitase